MFDTGFYNQGRGLESGLRAGAAIGGTIKGAMSTNAVQQAAARIQAGEDQATVIQQLMAQDPAAAQQLINLSRGSTQLSSEVQEIEQLKKKYGMQNLQSSALPLFGAFVTDDEKSQDKLIEEAAAPFKGQSDGVHETILDIKKLKGESRINALGGMVKALRQAGVYPDDPSQMMGMGQSADIAKFEYWKQMNPNATPEQMRAVYDKIIDPQARSYASGIGAGQARIETEQGLTPIIAGREQDVTVAKGRGEQQVNSEVNSKKNGVAFQTYRTAIAQLDKAAGQTTTNPLVGAFPALSANAQIMEGAVSMMAPLLKEVFRQAGEGTFTDKDQELLLAMVPTRSDHPEARKAKLQMIDNIIISKLQQQGGQPVGNNQPASQPQSFEDKYLGGGR